jgi:hypothetical protein
MLHRDQIVRAYINVRRTSTARMERLELRAVGSPTEAIICYRSPSRHHGHDDSGVYALPERVFRGSRRFRIFHQRG